MDDLVRALEERILDLLDQRDLGKTICPSEAARAVYESRTGAGAAATGGGVVDDSGGDEGWRELMEPARQAARRLVAAGRLEITQGGEVVDPDDAAGPVRLRLPDRG